MSTILYTVTDTNNKPIKLGSKKGQAWSNPRWIGYHLTKSWMQSKTSNYLVHTIDLAAKTVTSCSATAFIANNLSDKATSKLKTEIFAATGLPVDLVTLEFLARNSLLNLKAQESAKWYLDTKGIKF